MVLRSRAIYQVKELVCVPALCRFCRRSRVTSPLRPRARAESVTSACRVLARPAGCRRDPIPGIQPARAPPPADDLEARTSSISGGRVVARSAAVPPERSAWDPPAAVAWARPPFVRRPYAAVAYSRTRLAEREQDKTPVRLHPVVPSSCARVAGRGAPCIAARVRASSRTCAAVHVYSYILEM